MSRHKVRLVAHTLLYSLRTAGLRSTIQRGRLWLSGMEEWYVFVRYLQPTSVPVDFPLEASGITVRAMLESDVDVVARLIPFELMPNHADKRKERLRRRLPAAVVATRQGRIVGAAWYTDQVTPEQPWYGVVEPHLMLPARFTENIFVVPGDKAAAWAIATLAGQRLATLGVRTIVATIRCHNKPAMLIARLQGGKLVGRMMVRYRFGRKIARADNVPDEEAFGPSAHPVSAQRLGGRTAVRLGTSG